MPTLKTDQMIAVLQEQTGLAQLFMRGLRKLENDSSCGVLDITMGLCQLSSGTTAPTIYIHCYSGDIDSPDTFVQAAAEVLEGEYPGMPRFTDQKITPETASQFPGMTRGAQGEFVALRVLCTPEHCVVVYADSKCRKSTDSSEVWRDTPLSAW